MDKVFEVQRISDRYIQLKLIIGGAVFNFLAIYASQVGLPEVEKERFYGQLQSTVARVPASEILVSLGTGTVMLVLTLMASMKSTVGRVLASEMLRV